MSWSDTEVKTWRQTNDEKLAEINATLKPDTGKNGKIGIFLFGQVGDLATAMSVLKYRHELWPDKEIVWFTNWPNADLLRYAPISEVRMWPWAGNGLPEGTPDFYPLLCDSNNGLNKESAKHYELTEDLEDGYFPAPHMMTPEQRNGIDYPNISRKVFGIAPDRQWHPLLSWSDEEKDIVMECNLPLRKTIMIENTCGSHQSIWDDTLTLRTMEICREKWNRCNFLFASHKGHEQFNGQDGYYSLSDYMPRQLALFINHCDLFVGISSGISVVTSAWGLKPVPKLQYCGSHTCSTVSLAIGEISLITSDDLPPKKKEYAGQLKIESKLKEIISRIQ
jgi:hypothetical protein